MFCIIIKESSFQSLSHCELITDEGLRHLGTSACSSEHLSVLELDNCPLITDQSLDHLITCHSLQRIELYDCQLITRAGIRKLRVSYVIYICVSKFTNAISGMILWHCYNLSLKSLDQCIWDVLDIVLTAHRIKSVPSRQYPMPWCNFVCRFSIDCSSDHRLTENYCPFAIDECRYTAP